jgi:hypothetical protein
MSKNTKRKSKRCCLTAKEIIAIPDAPIGGRACDLEQTPEWIAENQDVLDGLRTTQGILRGRKLLDEAAEKLAGDGTKRPKYWRRALEVLKATGLRPDEYNRQNRRDEIEIVRAAAAMKRQQSKSAAEKQPTPILRGDVLEIGEQKYRLADQEVNVLGAIAEHGAMSKTELQDRSGQSHAPDILKQLGKKYHQLNVRTPGTKGKGGYSAKITSNQSR